MSHRAFAIPCLALLAALSLAPAVPALDGPIPVVAAGFSFTPAVLVVQAGTTIQWEGVLLPHTVTTTASAVTAATGVPNDPNNADGNPDTFAAPLDQGTSYSHTFNVPGQFVYYCEIHRIFGMVGDVTVV